MTLEEALAELGIDASAPPEAVRRAYLRRLKNRKPEVDPEGFRRLREALELVQAFRPPAGLPSLGDLALPALRFADDPGAGGRSPRAAEGEGVVPFRDVAAPGAPQALLESILALEAEGRSEAAGRLVRELEERLDASGREALAFQGEVAILWILARELSALPGDFPAPVRVAIARALRHLDPLRAVGELDDWAQREPADALAAARRLSPGSLLGRFFQPVLVYGGPPNTAAPRKVGSSRHGFRLPVGLGLGLIVVLSQVLLRPDAPLPRFAPSDPLPSMWRVLELDPELGRSCAGTSAETLEPCRVVREILVDLDLGACGQAWSELASLADLAEIEPPWIADLARRLGDRLAPRVQRACPSPPAAAPAGAGSSAAGPSRSRAPKGFRTGPPESRRS